MLVDGEESGGSSPIRSKPGIETLNKKVPKFHRMNNLERKNTVLLLLCHNFVGNTVLMEYCNSDSMW